MVDAINRLKKKLKDGNVKYTDAAGKDAYSLIPNYLNADLQIDNTETIRLFATFDDWGASWGVAVIYGEAGRIATNLEVRKLNIEAQMNLNEQMDEFYELIIAFAQHQLAMVTHYRDKLPIVTQFYARNKTGYDLVCTELVIQPDGETYWEDNKSFTKLECTRTEIAYDDTPLPAKNISESACNILKFLNYNSTLKTKQHVISLNDVEPINQTVQNIYPQSNN